MKDEHYYDLDYWKAFDGPFPQMVFADNARGLFSFLVKARTGFYGHFMWLIAKNTLASQWFYFQRQTFEHYAGAHLTLVANPKWSEMDCFTMLVAINKDLDLPAWQTRYDVIGVIGELFGFKWMNRKKLYFCSERGKYLKLVDSTYDLVSPDPQELRDWSKRAGFTVTGRYSPD